jgi:hypothetical protein
MNPETIIIFILAVVIIILVIRLAREQGREARLKLPLNIEAWLGPPNALQRKELPSGAESSPKQPQTGAIRLDRPDCLISIGMVLSVMQAGISGLFSKGQVVEYLTALAALLDHLRFRPYLVTSVRAMTAEIEALSEDDFKKRAEHYAGKFSQIHANIFDAVQTEDEAPEAEKQA